MTLGMVEGTPVGTADAAGPEPSVADVAITMAPGSHDESVFVPVGMMDCGGGVVAAVVVAEMVEGPSVVEKVGSAVGLVMVAVPLFGGGGSAVVGYASEVVMVPLEEAVGPGPGGAVGSEMMVELIEVDVTMVVPLVLVGSVGGAVAVPVGSKMLEIMLPNPVVSEVVVDSSGGSNSEDSQSPPVLVAVLLVVSDTVDDTPVAVGKSGGRVNVGRSISPPLDVVLEVDSASDSVSDGVAVVLAVFVAAVVVLSVVPGPKIPLKRSLSRLSLSLVVGVAAGVGFSVVVTTPPGPKVTAEVLDAAVEVAVVLVDFFEGVGWTMTVGRTPVAVAPPPSSISMIFFPPLFSENPFALSAASARARLGAGVAGAPLLVTRLMCLGK